MTMDLLQELQLRTHHLTPTDVLRVMGYSQPTPSAKTHYLGVRQSPYLGLEGEYRDERFGERGFLEALCRSVGIDETDSRPAIDSVLERLAEDRAAYRHWLFADTDFVRRSNPTTPIFAMAFTEHLRRLKFPLGFWRLSWEERLAAACQKAREHMHESGGHLVTWGEIQRYHYVFAEGRSIVISPLGEVLDERTDFDPPKATFGVEGSDQNLGSLFTDEND
ncbi:hypothetical protein HOP52_10895 [Halomonas campisalis]|uniref:Uncharacterized protein n=1 Tax=Billgrantia campisalis TaxID=74661 RepID=A0ABS9P905_9GAMM|nr:hypothetical protein [Halomonas campisalis]MCG6658261.1 hypothetical protein [Halomonas campisalis]MDR5862930.1 hypothetical protein [Halomonas campisalis]